MIQCSVRGRAVAARQAHNLEVVGANPTPATKISDNQDAYLVNNELFSGEDSHGQKRGEDERRPVRAGAGLDAAQDKNPTPATDTNFKISNF